MDIHNVYLHGDFKEEVYIKLPLDFHHPDFTKFCCLHKYLCNARVPEKRELEFYLGIERGVSIISVWFDDLGDLIN